MDVPEIPRFAELSTEADINYLCNIRDDKDYNIKYLPKEKVIVMRNCDISGNLLDLKLSNYVSKHFEIVGRTYKFPYVKLATITWRISQ